MLFQIGPITCDTFPFEVSKAERETTADFAKHALVSSPQDYEFAGEGTGTLNLSGQLLPYNIGGLSEIEVAHQLCASGRPQWVQRGDGRLFDWYVLTKVSDKHEYLSPTGVGFVIKYDLTLEKVPDPGADVAAGMIDTLLSLFGL